MMKFMTGVPRSRRTTVSALSLAAPLLIGGLAFWFLFAEFLAPFYVQGPPPGASEAAFRRALDREVPKILHRYRVPGMVIGTIVHGDPGRLYPYGSADMAHATPMTGQTVFQVASLAKSVTAWGVMTLVDAGRIDLDQPAERYLSAWPLAPSRFPSGAVTVRQLLTHTAGVSGGDDAFREPGERPQSPTELLGAMGPRVDGRPTAATLVAPAGQTFIYSPAGYTVLQMIIEHQSGRPFPAYMRDAVLRPLGMMSSSYGWDPGLRMATATPYVGDTRAGLIRLPQDVAADGLFSTAADLIRFVAAPVDGTLLPVGAGVISDRTAREIFTRPRGFSRSGMALLGADAPCLGCFIEQRDGGPVVISSIGADPGESTEIHTVPSTGDGLVVLTNSSHSELAMAQVDALWAAWRGLPPPQTARSLRALGWPAVVIVALACAAIVAIGVRCLNGILAGRRRFGAFNVDACVICLFDLSFVSVVGFGWLRWRGTVGGVPGFALVLQAALAVMLLVVTARLLFPKHKVADGAGLVPGRLTAFRLGAERLAPVESV